MLNTGLPQTLNLQKKNPHSMWKAQQSTIKWGMPVLSSWKLFNVWLIALLILASESVSLPCILSLASCFILGYFPWSLFQLIVSFFSCISVYSLTQCSICGPAIWLGLFNAFWLIYNCQYCFFFFPSRTTGWKCWEISTISSSLKWLRQVVEIWTLIHT